MTNQKDLRIKKLYEAGVTDPARIARKLGYMEGTGVERVLATFKRLKIDPEQTTMTVPSEGSGWVGANGTS